MRGTVCQSHVMPLSHVTIYLLSDSNHRTSWIVQTVKNDAAVKKEFNVRNFFSSSSKSSLTFHKVLQEKGIITPNRHYDHVSS